MSDSRRIYKNIPDNQKNSALLGGIPIEVREDEMFPHFGVAALGIFAQSCQQAERETAFLRLPLVSINAIPAFAEGKGSETALASIVILKKHPELLFRKKMTGQIWASPYQLLLHEGDVWAIKQVHTDILPLIQDGEAKAKAHFQEWFPNFDKKLAENMDEEVRFYDARNMQQMEEISKQLATIKKSLDVDPFNNDKPHESTKHAIEVLCKLFQPKQGEEIRSGLHFPFAIIKEIYNIYDDLPNNWSFFSMAVIKPALDALSTVDGQCCQHGLKNLDMDKGPSRRCHSAFRHPQGQPLNLTFVNDEAKLGVALLVDPYNGDVLFDSSTCEHFIWFNKNGHKFFSRPALFSGMPSYILLDKLWRTKAEVYEGLQREVNTFSYSP